jgi:hypothetical protein
MMEFSCNLVVLRALTHCRMLVSWKKDTKCVVLCVDCLLSRSISEPVRRQRRFILRNVQMDLPFSNNIRCQEKFGPRIFLPVGQVSWRSQQILYGVILVSHRLFNSVNYTIEHNFIQTNSAIKAYSYNTILGTWYFIQITKYDNITPLHPD